MFDSDQLDVRAAMGHWGDGKQFPRDTRPTARDNGLAFLCSLIGVGACVGLMVVSPW